MNNIELAMSAAFIVAMIGLVVLWKWEGIGGALVVGGMMAFYGLNFATSGRFPSGWFFRSVSCRESWLLCVGVISESERRARRS